MEKLRWDKQYCLEKLQQWRVLLAQPLDPVNLGCFRICFGILMVMYVYQYRSPALVNAIYLSCDFHFTYPLFDFLGLPLPTAAGLSVLLKVMGASALMVALGLLTRLSAAVFFSAFGYLFLLEKSQYNNHYYLILLLSIFL